MTHGIVNFTCSEPMSNMLQFRDFRNPIVSHKMKRAGTIARSGLIYWQGRRAAAPAMVALRKERSAARNLLDPEPFAAVLLDMNLPGWTEWPWLEPLPWLPRQLKLEGNVVLKMIQEMRDGPKVTVAISGIPQNNAWFMANGATHDAGGKDPAKIRKCLEDAKILEAKG